MISLWLSVVVFLVVRPDCFCCSAACVELCLTLDQRKQQYLHFFFVSCSLSGFSETRPGWFRFLLEAVPCDSAATVVRSCVGFHCSYGVSWLLRVLWNCCGVLLLLLFTTAELLLRAVTYSSDDDDFRLFCVGKIPWLAAAATTTHWYFSRNYYYSRRSLEVAGVDFSFFCCGGSCWSLEGRRNRDDRVCVDIPWLSSGWSV